MTTAKEFDSVRTTVNAENIFDGRTIPAGMQGVVLEAKPDGTLPRRVRLQAQTADEDGDFAQAVLSEGQYEVILRE